MQIQLLMNLKGIGIGAFICLFLSTPLSAMECRGEFRGEGWAFLCENDGQNAEILKVQDRDYLEWVTIRGDENLKEGVFLEAIEEETQCDPQSSFLFYETLRQKLFHLVDPRKSLEIQKRVLGQGDFQLGRLEESEWEISRNIVKLNEVVNASSILAMVEAKEDMQAYVFLLDTENEELHLLYQNRDSDWSSFKRTHPKWIGTAGDVFGVAPVEMGKDLWHSLPQLWQLTCDLGKDIKGVGLRGTPWGFESTDEFKTPIMHGAWSFVQGIALNPAVPDLEDQILGFLDMMLLEQAREGRRNGDDVEFGKGFWSTVLILSPAVKPAGRVLTRIPGSTARAGKVLDEILMGNQPFVYAPSLGVYTLPRSQKLIQLVPEKPALPTTVMLSESSGGGWRGFFNRFRRRSPSRSSDEVLERIAATEPEYLRRLWTRGASPVEVRLKDGRVFRGHVTDVTEDLLKIRTKTKDIRIRRNAIQKVTAKISTIDIPEGSWIAIDSLSGSKTYFGKLVRETDDLIKLEIRGKIKTLSKDSLNLKTTEFVLPKLEKGSEVLVYSNGESRVMKGFLESMSGGKAKVAIVSDDGLYVEKIVMSSDDLVDLNHTYVRNFSDEYTYERLQHRVLDRWELQTSLNQSEELPFLQRSYESFCVDEALVAAEDAALARPWATKEMREAVSFRRKMEKELRAAEHAQREREWKMEKQISKEFDNAETRIMLRQDAREFGRLETFHTAKALENKNYLIRYRQLYDEFKPSLEESHILRRLPDGSFVEVRAHEAAMRKAMNEFGFKPPPFER